MAALSPDQINELLDRAGTGAAVYLVGIGGCGMSGLGHLLLDIGFRVAGSDLFINEEIRQLRARGAAIEQGHTPARLIDKGAVLVVYSSAVRRDNPELEAAMERNIPVVRRALLLAALLRRQRGICIAGMHGKTTTAALLAFALENLQVRPSYAIGGLVPQFPRHARFNATANLYFAVEADESDGTLREFHPEGAIMLNVDEEHLDHYGNIEAVCREFETFAGQTRGPLVFCAEDGRLEL